MVFQQFIESSKCVVTKLLMPDKKHSSQFIIFFHHTTNSRRSLRVIKSSITLHKTYHKVGGGHSKKHQNASASTDPVATLNLLHWCATVLCGDKLNMIYGSYKAIRNVPSNNFLFCSGTQAAIYLQHGLHYQDHAHSFSPSWICRHLFSSLHFTLSSHLSFILPFFLQTSTFTACTLITTPTSSIRVT